MASISTSVAWYFLFSNSLYFILVIFIWQIATFYLGNEIIFSLETASDYVKDDKANFYGFKCLVTGYEWSGETYDGLKLLETELAFLGGMCSASLIKKDLVLPPSTGKIIAYVSH